MQRGDLAAGRGSSMNLRVAGLLSTNCGNSLPWALLTRRSTASWRSLTRPSFKASHVGIDPGGNFHSRDSWAFDLALGYARSLEVILGELVDPAGSQP